MNEENIEEPKTRSIVSEDCVLRPNHEGLLVTHMNNDNVLVTGLLLRYRCEEADREKHELVALTRSEFDECISTNKQEETLSD